MHYAQVDQKSMRSAIAISDHLGLEVMQIRDFRSFTNSRLLSAAPKLVHRPFYFSLSARLSGIVVGIA